MSIPKPPRKGKSVKRLSVVQEVSKEITPSEAGDATLRSMKSTVSSSSDSSGNTHVSSHSSEGQFSLKEPQVIEKRAFPRIGCALITAKTQLKYI